MGSFALFVAVLAIVAFSLTHGWLVMVAAALSAARKARLQRLAADGLEGAARLLELMAQPLELITVVRLSATMTAVATVGVGTLVFAAPLSFSISSTMSLETARATSLAHAVLFVALTSLLLVVGELVPRRMALARTEERLALSSLPLTVLMVLLGPLAAVYQLISELVLRLLRHEELPRPIVTDDEVRLLIDQGAAAGVFDKSESTMIKRVLRLDELRVDAVMTPRLKVVGLDSDDPLAENLARIGSAMHLYYPLFRGEWTDLAGIVSAKDVAAAILRGETIDLRTFAREPLYLSTSVSVARALDRFKLSGKRAALVIDEFGTVAGLLTLTDALESVVGELPDAGGSKPDLERREDGSWLIDGRFPLHDLSEALGVRAKALEALDARTMGGLIMHQLGRIPREGDRLFWEGFRVDVLAMDGRRVDKAVVAKATAKERPRLGTAPGPDAAPLGGRSR